MAGCVALVSEGGAVNTENATSGLSRASALVIVRKEVRIVAVGAIKRARAFYVATLRIIDDDLWNRVKARQGVVRDKLMRKDLFEEFCAEYTREMNRLRMERNAGAAKAERELTKIDRELRPSHQGGRLRRHAQGRVRGSRGAKG
jgi:hypothetical protein